MSILFNTFRNRLFATVMAGLALSNVALAGHGHGGGGGGGGKSFSGFSGKGAVMQGVAPAMKNFSAPKMMSQQQVMKSTQSNFINKQFGKVQTLNGPVTGKFDAKKLGSPKLGGSSLGSLKSSDSFKK